MADATIPFRLSSDHPTRRALLAGAAAAPALALPAIAAAETLDLHVTWFAEWKTLLDYLNGPATREVDDLADLPEYRRALELERLIGATPARTVAGALAQLRIIAQWHGPTIAYSACDGAGLANALATLERLAGSAVA
jgi:hypothetical protein